MARKKSILEDQDKFDITPMIDVVFLLLIYFIWTTDFTEEADMAIMLPVPNPAQDKSTPPQEHIVDVLPSGQIMLNGAPMDGLNSRGMPQLVRTLKRLKSSGHRSGADVAVTIFADSASLHQRSIDVLNACSTAKIKLVSFGSN